LGEHLYQGLRYLLMSGVSALLSLGIPFALHEGFSFSPETAVALGLGAAFVVNFLMAKLFVFQRKGSTKTQLGRYMFVSFIFRSGEYLSFLFVHGLFGVQYMVANASILFLSFCLKFFAYKLFVFRLRQKELQPV
jgi:putative flippase GtrA